MSLNPFVHAGFEEQYEYVVDISFMTVSYRFNTAIDYHILMLSAPDIVFRSSSFVLRCVFLLLYKACLSMGVVTDAFWSFFYVFLFHQLYSTCLNCFEALMVCVPLQCHVARKAAASRQTPV